MKVSIVTLEGTIFSSEKVRHVQLPTTAGEIGIYKNHMPLIARVGRGSVAIDVGDRKEFFTVADGVIEVRKREVIILASVAEPTKEEFAERLEKVVEEAKREALRDGIDKKARRRAQKLFAIEEARLKALRRRK